jgi:hypothetical protein
MGMPISKEFHDLLDVEKHIVNIRARYVCRQIKSFYREHKFDHKATAYIWVSALRFPFQVNVHNYLFTLLFSSRSLFSSATYNFHRLLMYPFILEEEEKKEK